MAIAWRSGSIQRILDGYQSYTRVLRMFSVDHDLGIFDAGHGALVDAAEEMGLIYKPCGAGGGDIGVVLGSDEAAIAAFVSSPAASRFAQLGAAIDTCGAQIVGEIH
jgi:phosphomevalonate kinase